jgi:hypothetical protein
MSGLSALAAIFLSLPAVGPFGSTPDPAPDPAAALSQLAVQRRDAARRTYQVMWANYREGRASEELLYRWSRRWLEAEKQLGKRPADQVAACRGHLERMRDVERIVRKLQLSGVTTLDQVNSVEFYRVEAEMWLLQAKEGKSP